MNLSSPRFSAAAAAVSLLVLSSTSIQAADKPGHGLKICISLDKINASREGQVKLWRKTAELLGVKLIEEVAGEDAQRQSSQIDTCIAKKVNGIIYIPWDYQAVLQDIERAHAAGIPFATMDQTPADLNTVDFHIGADPYADGMHAGQKLVKLVGDKPIKVARLQGALSAANGRAATGLQEWHRGPSEHQDRLGSSHRMAPRAGAGRHGERAAGAPGSGRGVASQRRLLAAALVRAAKSQPYAKVGAPDHVIVESSTATRKVAPESGTAGWTPATPSRSNS